MYEFRILYWIWSSMFFQILWKSRWDILVTFPYLIWKNYVLNWNSDSKKLNCGFFHSFHSWKNTTKQLFSSKGAVHFVLLCVWKYFGRYTPKTKSSKLHYENWQKNMFCQFLLEIFFLSQVISHIKTIIFIPTFIPNDFFGAFHGPKYFQTHKSTKWTAPFSVENNYLRPSFWWP